MKKKEKNINNKIEHWQIISIILIVYDIVAVNFSYFIALLFRFDLNYTAVPRRYLISLVKIAPYYTLFCLVVFTLLKLYKSLWRFASLYELIRIIIATIITLIFQILAIYYIGRMPIIYYVGGATIQFILLVIVRFSYRFYLLIDSHLKNSEIMNRVMIIGAGSAGQLLIRDNARNPKSKDKIVCIIDDNPNKNGRFIDNVPIVGTRDDILANVNKYNVDTIYLAIPSASTEDKRDILNICNEADCKIKTLSGIYNTSYDITYKDLKDISVEDLLGREPIKANLKEVYEYINNKVILVTGGGGSIGSELCRQIAAHNPKQLIIFDIYENSTYDIQLELKEKYPYLDLVVLIGSVRDSRRIFKVFEEYKPEIVYHAAAHKHVPLMEDSPCEAIKNNTIGTYKTAYAAMIHGCKRFVLISTDKAVNPTNIMGASKRLCEMIVQSFDKMIKEGKVNKIPQLFTHEEYKEDSSIFKETFDNIKTEFVAVRFGNVLGSNGSVIPIFKKQIEKGGPVTVTHPDIIRYFMTIPEAVSLVMLAGTYAKGGEIFVLDMGTPVKIDSLARNLIKLSGLKPDVDIKVEYTGLRPGEKLYEEKLMDEEGLRTTENKLIFIGKPIPFDIDEFFVKLNELMNLAYKNSNQMKEKVSKYVETYFPQNKTKA